MVAAAARDVLLHGARDLLAASIGRAGRFHRRGRQRSGHATGGRSRAAGPSGNGRVRPPAGTTEPLWQNLLIESIIARTMLLHDCRLESYRVLMITSAMPGEGKSPLAKPSGDQSCPDGPADRAGRSRFDAPSPIGCSTSRPTWGCPSCAREVPLEKGGASGPGRSRRGPRRPFVTPRRSGAVQDRLAFLFEAAAALRLHHRRLRPGPHGGRFAACQPVCGCRRVFRLSRRQPPPDRLRGLRAAGKSRDCACSAWS